MNQNYQIPNNNYQGYFMPNNYNQRNNNSNDERLAGGFVFPFLLGGVTGAAIAPNFYRPNYSYNTPYYYGPAPYYYRPRRWF